MIGLSAGLWYDDPAKIIGCRSFGRLNNEGTYELQCRRLLPYIQAGQEKLQERQYPLRRKRQYSDAA